MAVDSSDSVEGHFSERGGLSDSFLGLPRDFVHFFKRGPHHRHHGSWRHRHRGPLRATHPDSDEEDSPVSSMVGAFCKPAAFMRSQSLPKLTLSQSAEFPILHLRMGNIVTEGAEAIVVSCDPYLHHDGGCAGAVNIASRGHLQSLCNTYLQRHGKMSTGKAVAFDVGGGRLRCKHVICVVGPQSLQHSQDGVKCLLRASCSSVLEVALGLKVATLAVPSICAGAYGVDPKVGRWIALWESVRCAYDDWCVSEWYGFLEHPLLATGQEGWPSHTMRS